MFSLELFLGHPLTPELKLKLDSTNSHLVATLLDGKEYLTVQEGYIGKKLGKMVTLDQLENNEQHVLSLLKKLAPDYSFGPCQLLPLHLNLSSQQQVESGSTVS